VLVTQTGIFIPVQNLASSSTGRPPESLVFQNRIDSTNAPFGMTTPITTPVTLMPVVGTGPILVGPIIVTDGSDVPLAETEQYVISFSDSQQSVSLSSQIIDAPEPSPLAVLGIGLCAGVYPSRSSRLKQVRRRIGRLLEIKRLRTLERPPGHCVPAEIPASHRRTDMRRGFKEQEVNYETTSLRDPGRRACCCNTGTCQLDC
jgi:hypothetical protein